MIVDDIQEAINQINKWQRSEIRHPLTCPYDNRVLVPEEVNGELLLKCPDSYCSYTQNQVPLCCIDGSLEPMEAAWLTWLRKLNSRGE